MTPIGKAYIIALLDKAASKGQAELRRLWEDKLGKEYKADKDVREYKDMLKKAMEDT